LLAASEDSLLAMVRRLQLILPLDSEAVRRVVQRYHDAPYEPTLLVKNAPQSLVASLEERRTVLPGLVVQTEPKRSYPDSGEVAHLVGYVGEATQEQLAGADSGRPLGSIVGKEGLEREYESSLAGADGVRFVEVDALGRVVREEGAAQSLAAVPGQPVHTTIDLGLQRYVASIFPAGRRGAVVAMDPRTGDILALYSAPSYDPNAFVGGVDPAYWRSLNEDPGLPLLDRAIAARYPPASTFKLATAIMALKRGLVNFNSKMPLPCVGGIRFGNRFFKCWEPRGHGYLTLEQAIANSCDGYFYQLGLLLGVPNFLEDGIDLGFGVKSGVDLPGEQRPAFPASTTYYDRVYGKGGWTRAVAMNLAIGQGENAQTLVNMVRFYAALANGGPEPQPHILAEPSPRMSRVDLPDTIFAGIRRSLIAVVEQGTARGARLATLHIAGKTGTAQNPQGKDHAWFIAFAPAEAPRIVVGAIIEEAGHGSGITPTIGRIIERYLLGPDSTRDRAAPWFRLPGEERPGAAPVRVGDSAIAGTGR
ncbi:MAG TPA: penicillin-binding transpeptidase domain-containing protein, partial [Gemmatimonadales bacterium]|nr:penicillin-binding transpeptidase domain-containing protein [Gemmatimonadales bacterium]